MAIQKYKGHLALLGAAIMWGLMSPIGKTALENGISGLSLATFRMTGGAICFWIASIFAPKEQVKPHDLMMLFFAGLLGIVLNQGCFTFGLSLTSPIDASIVTTTAPIATMIVAAHLSERTGYREKSDWYFFRFNRSLDTHIKQPRLNRWKRRKYSRRFALPGGTNQFLILSGYFQRTDQQIQHIYFNEMDVHLCSHLLYSIFLS